MQLYVDEYTDFMANVKHKSLNTIQSYKRDVNHYIEYLNKTGINDFDNVTSNNVTSYLTFLEKKGRSASTVSRALAAVRSFYIFMLQNGNIECDPTSKLETPHVERKLPTVLRSSEIEALSSQAKDTDKREWNVKSMLES